MPSSLTMVPPIASVCSTRPPVSVLVRAPAALARAVFLGGMGSAASPLWASSRVSALTGAGLAWLPAYALSRGRPEPRTACPSASPLGLGRAAGGTGMSARCASATPPGLALAPD